MAGDSLEIPLFMTVKLEKYDGDPPRFHPGDKIPFLVRVKAFLTGEVLTKEPIETIERTYCLTKEEAKEWEELKNGTT